LAAASGLRPTTIARYAEQWDGLDVVTHIARVSCGLESMVLGESEIQGQVADALTVARRTGSAGQTLTMVFETALHTARRARAETAIGRHAASVSSVAAELVDELARDVPKPRLLLVGAGRMGRVAAEALAARQSGSLVIASRTPAHARALADRVKGEAHPLTDLPALLPGVDVVLTACAAADPILTTEMVEAARAGVGERPLAIVDIGVPRNVEPGVGELRDVRLTDVDHLRARVARARADRAREIPMVEALIDEEVKAFDVRLARAALLSTVDALRRRAERVRQATVAEVLREAPADARSLEPVLEQLSSSLVRALLDAPTRRLRAEASNGHAVQYADFARRVFALDDVPPSANGEAPSASA
jgi:glutamyl-tRNA reductase